MEQNTPDVSDLSGSASPTHPNDSRVVGRAPHRTDRAGSAFSQALEAAALLPMTRIDRAAYLGKALRRHCTDEQVAQAIAESPAAARVPLAVLDQVARESIKHETRRVTGLAAAMGLPGGMAMVATVPADAAQYMAHMLRIAQKLAYLYSWPDLFAPDSDQIDDATEGVLTLFVGVMFGVNAAQTGVAKVSEIMAKNVARKLPQQALTKGTVYPVVKAVAKVLGVRMTKQMFARGASKAIPVLGAVASGGLAYGTFRPMAKKLHKHLASLEITKPGLRPDVAVATGAEPA